MLHAITQKNSSIYRRYLGERDGKEKRVHEEDELTALLLGPLALMPGKETAVFWHGLLRDLKTPDYTSQSPEEPEKAIMQFWPSMETKEPNRRIEPDLLVELFWPNGQKIKLVVELKWRASLSGKDQLHRQWQYCFSDAEKQTGYHLFLAPETSAALTAQNDSQRGDVWGGRLLAISWYQMIGILKHCPPLLQPWAEQVTTTLQKLGIRRFGGFKNLQPTPVFSRDVQQPLFWKGFLGFQHLNESFAINPALKATTPLFFSTPEEQHHD